MSSDAYMYIKYTYSRTGLWCNLDLFTIVDVSDGNFKIHQLSPWCFILLYAYLNEVHYAQVQKLAFVKSLDPEQGCTLLIYNLQDC